MSNLVNPHLARFAADLNDLWEKFCEGTDDEFFSLFAPVEIRLYTGDGYTAKFWEDGIEFYPKVGEA